MQKHRATHSCTSFTVFPGTFFSKRLGQLVLLAALFIVPFLTSAQSWDTVRIVDFSNPSFNPNLSGVQGFNAVGFTLGNNGASGNFNDLCAFTSSFSAQDRIAMRVSLLAGVDYRVSLNGKVNRAGQAVNFAYAPASNPQQVTVISQSIPLADIDYNDPGATVESNTFAVAADGNYWVVAEHGGVNLPDVFARLDNFRVEALQEAPMPSLSLTDNDGNPITGGIEAEPGTPFMLCLSPDSAPAGDMALELGIDGDGSPHFSDFTTMPLTFPAGSTDEVCFELSPSAEAVAGTYTFQLTDGNGEEVVSFEVVVEPPCTSVAGPDHIICAGETVQLGTGCLPAPHPLIGVVDYCYAWVPADGLDDPASAMPNATPSETTTYTVYVTTSEGELIVEENVTVAVESFDFEITSTSQILCPGESALLEVPNSYEEYSWTKDGEVIGDEHTIEVFSFGLYSIEITNSNGCTSTADIYIAESINPLSIKDFFLNKGFMCIPIDVVGEVGLQNPSTQGNRSILNSYVEDCANLNIQIMDEGGDEGFNIADVIESYLSNQNFSAFNDINGYVTANDVLCSPLQSCNLTLDQIVNDFLSSDIGYWAHIWENPNIEGDDCLLISAKLPGLNSAFNPLVHPTSLGHEELIMASLELFKIDGPNTDFPNLWERLSFALLDLLRNQFLPDVLQNSWCEGCQLSLQSEAPQNPQNPTKSMTWFINEIMAIEDSYPAEEQTNLKLMITRFRRIFYNSNGFNSYLIPGATSEASQSPFGSPSIIERDRLTVERPAPFGDFDLIDNEVYPIDPFTLERPEIYVNQQVELDAGNYSGVYIDMGHVFCGLDAYNFTGPVNGGQALTELTGVTLTWIFSQIGVNSNMDAVTWVGDLASSLAYAQIASDNHEAIFSQQVPESLLQDAITRGTPPQDMVGNIDAYVISQYYNIGEENGTVKVSDILKNYYLGVEHNDIQGNGLELYQNKRFSIFANYLGLIPIDLSGGTVFLNSQEVIDQYFDQIADAAAFFIGIGMEKPEGLFSGGEYALWLSYNRGGKRLMELLISELGQEISNE